MNIFLPNNFLQREITFCFLALYRGKQMRQNTHGVSILMMNSKVFDDLILRSFDLCDAIQPVNSVERLPHYIQLLQIQRFSLQQISLSIYYYFTNIFWVHPGHAIVHVFYPRSTRCSDSLHILSFDCQTDPYRGQSTS